MNHLYSSSKCGFRNEQENRATSSGTLTSRVACELDLASWYALLSSVKGSGRGAFAEMLLRILKPFCVSDFGRRPHHDRDHLSAKACSPALLSPLLSRSIPKRARLFFALSAGGLRWSDAVAIRFHSAQKSAASANFTNVRLVGVQRGINTR